MVAAFDYCLHGKGGAAPSIDTAMHGLVDAAHVDHLHPDSGIAIATAADGEQLTKEIFGDKVVWVPWRRPGFQLGLDIAKIKSDNPQAIGCILGGHGITAWGDTSRGVRAELAVDHRHGGGVHRRALARPSRSARRSTATAPCPRRSGRRRRPRWRRRCARSRRRTSRWSVTSPTTRGCWSSWPRPSIRGWPPSAPRCPDHFLRTKVKPLVLDLPADASVEDCIARLEGAARGVPGRLPGLLRPQRDRRTRRPSGVPIRRSS